MSRQLTALERRRITGTTSPIDQLAAFEALGIPAHARNPTGHLVIECVAYTTDARPHFTPLEWTVIQDEHIIGTGLSSIRNQRVVSQTEMTAAEYSRRKSPYPASS